MPEKLVQFSQIVGLHPLVAIGMAAMDVMLFGGEAVTLGVSWPISIATSVVLTIPCVLIQRSSFGDSTEAAVGKGVLVGLLTAIPTALPSFVTVIIGVAGVPKMLADNNDEV